MEYERMVEEIELLSDVRTAIQQIEAGKGVANEDAKLSFGVVRVS